MEEKQEDTQQDMIQIETDQPNDQSDQVGTEGFTGLLT